MKSITLLLALVIITFATSLPAQDVTGSKDHPLITRYPGSVIEWYDVSNFTPYHIAVGDEVSYRTINDWVDVEGKLTRIYYTLQGERTMTEVYLNYLNAVKRAGFTVLSQGVFQDRNVQKKVGGGSWLGVHYGRNISFPSNSGINLLKGSSDTGGTCFFAAKLSTASGMVYIAIGGHQYSQREVVFMVDIIEGDKLEDGLVTVDAKAMGESIDRDGRVAIYGIHFATDRSDILPESAGTITEIAKLLTARPSLKLYVVGHTDATGSLDHNMKLSEQRAQAVVAALLQQHGVAADRLIAKGVGPLAPVSTNSTETGRAANRRVELVQQ